MVYFLYLESSKYWAFHCIYKHCGLRSRQASTTNSLIVNIKLNLKIASGGPNVGLRMYWT